MAQEIITHKQIKLHRKGFYGEHSAPVKRLYCIYTNFHLNGYNLLNEDNAKKAFNYYYNKLSNIDIHPQHFFKKCIERDDVVNFILQIRYLRKQVSKMC